MPRPRKPLGTHLGHSDSKRDAIRAQWAKKLPPNSRVGAPQPNPNSNWNSSVKAWWKALGMSDTAMVYQEFDWVNAWVAGDVLQQLYDDGFSAGLYKEWQHTCEWLHAPRVDLLAEEVVDTPADDEEDEGLESEIANIEARLVE